VLKVGIVQYAQRPITPEQLLAVLVEHENQVAHVARHAFQHPARRLGTVLFQGVGEHVVDVLDGAAEHRVGRVRQALLHEHVVDPGHQHGKAHDAEPQREEQLPEQARHQLSPGSPA